MLLDIEKRIIDNARLMTSRMLGLVKPPDVAHHFSQFSIDLGGDILI